MVAGGATVGVVVSAAGAGAGVVVAGGVVLAGTAAAGVAVAAAAAGSAAAGTLAIKVMVIATGTIAARAPKVFISDGSDRIKCTNGPQDQANCALATWRFEAANRQLPQHDLRTRCGKQAFSHP